MQNNTLDNLTDNQTGNQMVDKPTKDGADDFLSINEAVKLTAKAPNTIRGLISRESKNKKEHFKKVLSPKGDKWYISRKILEETFQLSSGNHLETGGSHDQNFGTHSGNLYVMQLNSTVKKLEQEVEFLKEMLKSAQETIKIKDVQFSTTLTELVSKQNDLMKQISEENTRVSENFQKLMGMRDQRVLLEDVESNKKGFFSRIFGV